MTKHFRVWLLILIWIATSGILLTISLTGQSPARVEAGRNDRGWLVSQGNVASGRQGTPTSPSPTSTQTPRPTVTATGTPAITLTPTQTASPTPTQGAEHQHIAYLALIFKRWPPVPYTPELNTIDNSDEDGEYSVSWSHADLAEFYVLEEAESTTFATPAVRYTGPDTLYSVTEQPFGIWHYRVRACNSYGCGTWSNVESAFVSPPTRFYSVADTYVAEGLPSENFGSGLDMWVGYDHDAGNHVGQKTVRSLIRFDLAAIPPRTEITQATLSLYLRNWSDLGHRPHTITPYRLSEGWSELSVAWDDQPDYADAYSSTVVTTGTFGRNSFDVTDLVRDWADGSFPNLGLMLRGPEFTGSDGARLGFYTREISDLVRVPYLEVTYAGTATGPTDAEDAGKIMPDASKRRSGVADVVAPIGERVAYPTPIHGQER